MEEVDKWYLQLEDNDKYELLESIYVSRYIIGDVNKIFLLLDKRIKKQVYQENKNIY